MREVRACDFCGEGASGVYEPLSPALEDGPRTLLCDDCGETLSGLLEPLFERLEGDGGVDVADEIGGAGASAHTTPAPDPAEEPVAQADSEPTPSTESNSESARSASQSSSEIGGRPAGQRKGTPRGYRKVMRFLENREFPIDRDEAETMASEAYDLDPGTVAASIDHAKKHGRLREVRGQLKR